jgi:hypothetical protein
MVFVVAWKIMPISVIVHITQITCLAMHAQHRMTQKRIFKAKKLILKKKTTGWQKITAGR